MVSESYYEVTGISHYSDHWGHRKEIILVAMDWAFCNIEELRQERYALVPVTKYDELCKAKEGLETIQEILYG